MPQLSAARVAEITGGRLIGDGSATAHTVVHDSRSVSSGVAFAAVGGGIDFVREALDAGAPFAIAEHEVDASPLIVVTDTVRALGELAKAVRAASSIRVVGITGSTGKTLTKDLITAVLSTKYRTHTAPNSYNNEIGVPLVVLGCPDETEILVSELAARHGRDIAYLTDIVRPETGVITGIGITHVAEFGSRDAIADTKADLLRSLPDDGLAIVPSDDDYLSFLVASTQARVRCVGPGSSVRYSAQRIDRDGVTHGTVTVDGERLDVSLAVPGRALLRNVAMAIAVGVAYGVPPKRAAEAVANASLSSWRMQILEIEPWTVVNDAWNSSPTSIASALHATKEMAGDGPVWAVLGGMAELGEIGPAEHRRAGALAVRLGYEGLILVGDLARLFADGAGAIARTASDPDAAAELVRTCVPPGAHLLVKASRSVGLERFPDILMARSGPAERRA